MARLRLGEILIQERKIDDAQLKSALSYQRQWGRKIGECLTRLNFISEADLCQTLSRIMKIPIVDVSKIDSRKVTKDLLQKVSITIARQHRLVPLAIKEIKSKKRLVIATSDPTNFTVFDDLQFKTGYPLLIMISPDSDIDWFIRKYYLGEIDVLSQNYTSGIEVSTPRANDFIQDNYSQIFWDENFTVATNAGVKTGQWKPKGPNPKNKS